MDKLFEKSKNLLGQEAFYDIQNKVVCVVGLGGVGGTCFESLVRTGFEKFIIVDKDVVDASNINRQILYTSNDINKDKVEVAKQKAEQINPDVKVITLKMSVDRVSINELKKFKIDFLVDGIDDMNGKLSLIDFAQKNNVPFISSLGMANKLDPSKIKIAKLNKTTVDPLGKKLRHLVKENSLSLDFDCVYSDELPNKNGSELNSIITVTSTAGLFLTKYIVDYFIKK